MCLHPEESMIGVQCHWWFVEDTLEHLRVHFKFFEVDGSMANWHFSQFLHFISSQIWKGCKFIRRSKILSGLNLNMVYWDPVQKQENFVLECHRSEKDVPFRVQNIKVPFGIGHPSTYTSNLIYMCAGGFRGHKSSNRIELSRFIQDLL